MSLQLLILKIYETLFRWIQSWILPLLLVFAYLTAIGLLSPRIVDTLGRSELIAVHLIIGLLIISVTIVLTYDAVIIWYYEKKGLTSLNPDRQIFFRKNELNRLRSFVAFLFYVFLVLLSVTGGLLFMLRFDFKFVSIPHVVYLYTLHKFAAVYMVSVILVKYYLKLTQWLKTLNEYLREH